MLAEKSEPQPPQRIGAVQHHLHQPAGMGAGVKGQRQLHDVLEIIGQHRLALAVRQLVGMQRNGRAAHDGEQAERDPCRQQRPRRGRCNRAGRRACRRARRRSCRTAPARRIARRPAADWRRPGSSPAAPLCRATAGRGCRGGGGACGGLRISGTECSSAYSNQGSTARYSCSTAFVQLIRRPPDAGRNESSKISASAGLARNLTSSAS